MTQIITLTTDFGPDSPYVGQMKGVLLSRNPAVTIVDITHTILPQDVARGALALDDAARWFPANSIHVAVVDPGVGTERRLVYARIGEQHFLAPDNGLLGLVARRAQPDRIVTLTESRFWQPEVSATFHGRDILAPVAAHLSLGVEPGEFGPTQDSLLPLDWPLVRHAADECAGCVVAIDSFGNLITNITGDDLARLGAAQVASGPSVARVRCRGNVISPIGSTYGNHAAGSLVALVGSNGRLEIAVVHGHAAARLDAKIGDDVAVTFRSPSAGGLL